MELERWRVRPCATSVSTSVSTPRTSSTRCAHEPALRCGATASHCGATVLHCGATVLRCGATAAYAVEIVPIGDAEVGNDHRNLRIAHEHACGTLYSALRCMSTLRYA